jgi:hypothetical protein
MIPNQTLAALFKAKKCSPLDYGTASVNYSSDSTILGFSVWFELPYGRRNSFTDHHIWSPRGIVLWLARLSTPYRQSPMVVTAITSVYPELLLLDHFSGCDFVFRSQIADSHNVSKIRNYFISLTAVGTTLRTQGRISYQPLESQ